jgi:hypothetical protein
MIPPPQHAPSGKAATGLLLALIHNYWRRERRPLSFRKADPESQEVHQAFYDWTQQAIA